jgi:hypothetical protein
MKPDKVRLPFGKHDLLKDEIDGLTSLKLNWDGYGAIPVLDKIAQTAKQLIGILGFSFVERISDIFPNAHGTLTMEWENSHQEKLSLEIGENNYSYFIKFNTINPKFVNGENILSDLATITQDLGELFRKEIPHYNLR